MGMKNSFQFILWHLNNETKHVFRSISLYCMPFHFILLTNHTIKYPNVAYNRSYVVLFYETSLLVGVVFHYRRWHFLRYTNVIMLCEVQNYAIVIFQMLPTNHWTYIIAYGNNYGNCYDCWGAFVKVLRHLNLNDVAVI